jgi:hypothetical protein
MKMIRIFILLFISSVRSISIDIRYPQFFHQYDSIVEITEGKTAGSFIAFINLINYTNINLNEWLLNTTNKDFQIQSNGISYSLITTEILDRERQNFYNFSIDAQHLISPYEKLSKNIYIHILDINDCTPTFNQTIYQTTLIPNETNYRIQAFDCDESQTENSRISYLLSNYQDLFHINQTTGLIECIKNLNTYERYEIIVVAYDHGKPSLSSTTLVQIQLIPSKFRKIKSLSWLHMEQSPVNMLILIGILASCFIFILLFICLICCINYKFKRRGKDKKKFSSTSTINSLNDFQQTSIYDAIKIFPNTLYLPVKQQTEFIDNNNTTLNIPQSSSTTTSSPISTTDITVKIGSDDGCYCSSDMSSEQSNNILLLNPSSLNSKHVRFNQTNNNNMNGVLQRFENLYGSQGITDHCASYV